jgi:hypothetical protein
MFQGSRLRTGMGHWKSFLNSYAKKRKIRLDLRCHERLLSLCSEKQLAIPGRSVGRTLTVFKEKFRLFVGLV